VEEAVRSALVIVTCLIAAACSTTGPEPRPLESGFGTTAGVADPYEDGKRHLAGGRYDVAVERFGQALARDRDSLDALNGLAIAHSRLGRFDMAQTYFERALQVDATSPVTLNNYGWSLIEQGRLRDARPFLELALHRAAEADVPLVAANVDSIRRAKPPALIAALQSEDQPGARFDHRLIRVAANVHRLETVAGPVGPPEPATVADDAPSPKLALLQHPAAVVSPEQARLRADTPSSSFLVAEGIALAESALDSAAQTAAAEPDLDMPVEPQPGEALMEIRPVPVPEAAAILAGDKT
jgi:tetratricopeptide (TPR) repeat protein